MRGRGHPRHAAVFAAKYGVHLAGGDLPLAHLNEGPHDTATHLVEKTIAFDDERKQRPLPLQLATVKGAYRGRHWVIAISGKGPEVVLADQTTGGGAHGRQIQPLRDMPRRVSQQRILRGEVPDKVTVLFAAGAESGMKFRRASLGIEDADIFRQMGVEREDQFAGGHLPFLGRNVHMSDHAYGVNTGISSAGAVQPFLTREQFAQGSLDALLNPYANLLRLPTGIVGAVVGNGQLDSDWVHGASSSPVKLSLKGRRDSFGAEWPPPFYRPFPFAWSGARWLGAKRDWPGRR